MEEKVSSARIALKYGIIIAVISMVYYTVLYLSGLFLNPVMPTLGYLIIIGGLYSAMQEYKQQNNGIMSYGDGLGLGTLTSAIGALLTISYDLIYKEFIDTTINTQVQNKLREQFEAQGMDDLQIDQMVELTAKWSSPGIVFFSGIFVTIITGFIVSLILAAILKKNKSVFDN